ncbi:hypothetical protein D187_007247 [Cystobacter fuscus DSM 2262]|uniref:Uncharacterized protein n=1 Tax=Cystobacter fuscus (strain ATCC 25194 / DSM 2262 / NBRC 100088 / M29) TaxID=1242864 RepID=S9P3G6_CYSF2|nr:hypothetical protein [Cystobacter fuscus]EPX56812.1 hypothetical protein D187_007247 [Cystobacter fuscus DSM 2262]
MFANVVVESSCEDCGELFAVHMECWDELAQCPDCAEGGPDAMQVATSTATTAVPDRNRRRFQ